MKNIKKAMAFVPYIGKKTIAWFNGVELTEQYNLDFRMLNEYSKGTNRYKFKVVLKPLSAITNLDATNIAIMFHSTSLKSKYIKKYTIAQVPHEDTIKVLASNKDGDGIGGTVSINYKNGYVCWEPCEWRDETDYYESKLQEAMMYLLSKGYDMPSFYLNGKTLNKAGLAVYK